MINQSYLVAVMAFAALLGAGGQIMLKKASTGTMTLQGILSNWYLFAFVVLYGAAVLINIGAYRLGGKVAILYPVISLSYAFSAFFAWKFLGEPISGWTFIGTVVIIIGVSLIGYGATLPGGIT